MKHNTNTTFFASSNFNSNSNSNYQQSDSNSDSDSDKDNNDNNSNNQLSAASTNSNYYEQGTACSKFDHNETVPHLPAKRSITCVERKVPCNQITRDTLLKAIKQDSEAVDVSLRR